MRGKLDFAESLRQRLALLRGLSASGAFQQLRERLVFTKGAARLMHELTSLGHITAIVSGGFLPVAEHVRQQLGCTLCFANVLEEDGKGCLTGAVAGDILDGSRKRDILLEVAAKHGIPRERVGQEMARWRDSRIPADLVCRWWRWGTAPTTFPCC